MDASAVTRSTTWRPIDGSWLGFLGGVALAGLFREASGTLPTALVSFVTASCFLIGGALVTFVTTRVARIRRGLPARIKEKLKKEPASSNADDMAAIRFKAEGEVWAEYEVSLRRVTGLAVALIGVAALTAVADLGLHALHPEPFWSPKPSEKSAPALSPSEQQPSVVPSEGADTKGAEVDELSPVSPYKPKKQIAASPEKPPVPHTNDTAASMSPVRTPDETATTPSR